MIDIEIYKGDTIQIEISLTNNGIPFVPKDEMVVFSVGKVIGKPPLFIIPVVEGIVNINHDMTKDLPIGKYLYDIRVYTKDKALVATPCIGNFIIKGVVNDDL